MNEAAPFLAAVAVRCSPNGMIGRLILAGFGRHGHGA